MKKTKEKEKAYIKGKVKNYKIEKITKLEKAIKQIN